jgi:hypothetical protein
LSDVTPGGTAITEELHHLRLEGIRHSLQIIYDADAPLPTVFSAGLEYSQVAAMVGAMACYGPAGRAFGRNQRR